MKKVLIIIGKLYIGGAERVGRDIGFFADPEKYEIHYLVFGDDQGAYEPELLEKGCRIHHIPSPTRNQFAYLRTLIKLFREYRFDVVHSHTMFSSGWAMLAGKLCAVPCRITHSHSIRGPEKRSWVKQTYEKGMRWMILCCATHYVACGNSAGEWLYGENTYHSKGILIYNGIELSRFAFDVETRQKLRQELGLENRFVIGHAGHMAPVKNQAFLLEQMPEILKRKPEAMLLLLGDGTDRGFLEEKVRNLDIERNVIMTGNVNNVAQYLNVMDVFAFPSLYEGMPLAMIEAQTNGLPCVISDRIPGDVHLTDLVTVLSLEENEKAWVDALCSAERSDPGMYWEKMQTAGLDTSGMLERIYGLYEGNTL